MKNAYGEDLIEYALILECGCYPYLGPAPAAWFLNVPDRKGTLVGCSGACHGRFGGFPLRKVVDVVMAGTDEFDRAWDVRRMAEANVVPWRGRANFAGGPPPFTDR